ncbi:hypothetical protein PM082_004321 [Marasmius tenuissimus]|nr:hypothetical protein PM082_004321 [Marasmius tenuissimus]
MLLSTYCKKSGCLAGSETRYETGISRTFFEPAVCAGKELVLESPIASLVNLVSRSLIWINEHTLLDTLPRKPRSPITSTNLSSPEDYAVFSDKIFLPRASPQIALLSRSGSSGGPALTLSIQYEELQAVLLRIFNSTPIVPAERSL